MRSQPLGAFEGVVCKVFIALKPNLIAGCSGDLFSPTQQVLALQGVVGEGENKLSNLISARAKISIEGSQSLSGKLITLLI